MAKLPFRLQKTPYINQTGPARSTCKQGLRESRSSLPCEPAWERREDAHPRHPCSLPCAPAATLLELRTSLPDVIQRTSERTATMRCSRIRGPMREALCLEPDRRALRRPVGGLLSLPFFVRAPAAGSDSPRSGRRGCR